MHMAIWQSLRIRNAIKPQSATARPKRVFPERQPGTAKERDPNKKPAMIRIAPDLLQRIDRGAKRPGISRSAFILSSTAESLRGWNQTDSVQYSKPTFVPLSMGHPRVFAKALELVKKASVDSDRLPLFLARPMPPSPSLQTHAAGKAP